MHIPHILKNNISLRNSSAEGVLSFGKDSFHNSFKYWLLDLHKPEVVAILDEFAKEYYVGMAKNACNAFRSPIHRHYAAKLVEHLEIWDVEDIEDHEIMARMLRDYCTEQDTECNIKFVLSGILLKACSNISITCLNTGLSYIL